MALPQCRHIAELPDPSSLTLPGGVTIEAINLMQQVQPALAPLMPLFNVIDTFLAVFQCIKAVPDTIGPPPDPTVLASAISELAKKVNKLLKLIPQLSLPYTIVGVVDLVLDALREARSELLHLQAQSKQILGVVDRAMELDDPGLLAVAQCAQANVAQEAANVGKRLASMGKLMGLLNLFLGMVGGPVAPDYGTRAGDRGRGPESCDRRANPEQGGRYEAHPRRP